MPALATFACLQALVLVGLGLAALFGRGSGWTSIDDAVRMAGGVSVLLGVMSAFGAHGSFARSMSQWLVTLLVVPGTAFVVFALRMLCS